jgi:hypothetical protein
MKKMLITAIFFIIVTFHQAQSQPIAMKKIQEVAKKIPRGEGLSLIKSLNGILDAYLYEEEFIDGYILSDGRLLILNEHNAVVYPSKNAFLSLSDELNSFAQAHPISHILQATNSIEDDFLVIKDSLKAALVAHLGNKGIFLKGDIGDTKILDNVFEEGGLDAMEWFPTVVAVIGDTILAARHGVWKLDYNSVFGVWEPNLYLDSKIFHPWLIAHQALLEDLEETGTSSLFARTNLVVNH